MKNIKEILIIVIFSSAIGIAYNFTLPKPLPLIREKTEPIAIDDSILFGTSLYEKDKNEDSIVVSNEILNTNLNIENISENIKEKPSDSLLVSKKDESVIVPSKQDVIEAHSYLGKTVTYEQVKKIINNPEFIIIDARNPENYEKDIIGNAINIFPYGDEQAMFESILNLPQDKKLLIYCDGGNCDASHKLAEIIISLGYTKVFIYSGGWEEWTLKRSKQQ